MKFYTGKISEVLDRNLYTVKVIIPGLTPDNLGVPAFPKRGEIDEPKIGDLVILEELDNIFGGVLIYSKLKENDFNGIRCNGKLIVATEDEIKIGIYNNTNDYNDSEIPETTDWIKIDKDGNIDINARKDCTININGNVNINCPGTIQLGGGGVLKTTKGTCSPTGTGGFCGIPICPYSGTTHIGNLIIGI